MLFRSLSFKLHSREGIIYYYIDYYDQSVCAPKVLQNLFLARAYDHFGL